MPLRIHFAFQHQAVSTPATRNALLEHLFELLSETPLLSGDVLEWLLALLHGILPSCLAETSVAARCNQLVVGVIDQDNIKTCIRMRPTATLGKLAQAFKDCKNIARASSRFQSSHHFHLYIRLSISNILNLSFILHPSSSGPTNCSFSPAPVPFAAHSSFIPYCNRK